MTPALVERAIRREPDAVHELVRSIGPVIYGRVSKALLRRAHGRNVAQEVDDLVQEVFVVLFDHDAKALRTWDPERGPLGGFVALLTDHHVFSAFRSSKRRPFSHDVDSLDELDAHESREAEAKSPEARVASQETLDTLLERLRTELSPKGFEIFVRLYVHDQAIDVAARELGMTVDALYVWRTRLSKLVKNLASEIEEAEREDSRRVSEVSEIRVVRSIPRVEAS